MGQNAPMEAFCPNSGAKRPVYSCKHFFLLFSVADICCCKTTLYSVYYNTCYRFVDSFCIKLHKYRRKSQKNILPHPTLLERCLLWCRSNAKRLMSIVVRPKKAFSITKMCCTSMSLYSGGNTHLCLPRTETPGCLTLSSLWRRNVFAGIPYCRAVAFKDCPLSRACNAEDRAVDPSEPREVFRM